MKFFRTALAVLLAPALLAGCLATKQDVELLRTEMQASREAQDRSIQQLVRRMEAMLDSLSTQNVRFRGDLANRMERLDRQIAALQELTGEGQQQLADLRRRVGEQADAARRREQQQQAQARAADTVTVRGSDTVSTGGGDDEEAGEENPGQLYDAALAAFRRGSHSTARTGFQEFLRVAPRDRRAADAQFYIGETYPRDPESAIAAYALVVERYSASPRAPAALLRIGKLELARGNRTQARARFNQIVRAYPRSDEAEEARTELARLGRASGS